MAGPDPMSWWRQFHALPKDSTPKTLAFALAIALASATVVSIAAVTLRPVQEANLERERQARIVAMVSRSIGETGPLTAHMVNLETGALAPDVDPVTFDPEARAKNPETSVAIPKEKDVAGLGRRAKHAPVFIRYEGDKPALIVLPVYGMGYQSTLWGYLALKGDANTIAGLSFYKQGETPGLGARITEPAWQALWPGKKLMDESGTLRIDVTKGSAKGPYEVDGIAGATRTSNAVSNLLRFWLGDFGFGPFLKRVKSGEIRP